MVVVWAEPLACEALGRCLCRSYTDAVDDGAPDPGIARAGAAVAARRAELGISQRQLARQKVITAAALIAFEKGRAWPRERTRQTLEELLQWPAGTIARIRAGAPVPDSVTDRMGDDDDASLMADAFELTLARFDQAIEDLPPPIDIAFAQSAQSIVRDLRKLERINARALRHTHGSPVVIKALSTVRGRYEELMLRAAASPGATLGQRLYAARCGANLTEAEAAAAVGATAELVEAVEVGEPVDAATAERLESLIKELRR
jgi:transcriptional regulator with XRE-family HTH domain